MPDVTELEDRIAKCNKILDENPNSQIFAALAEAYRKKGELDKAFRVCQNGLRIHANYGSAHMVMAKINLDKGLYDWAQMEVEKAIDLDGNSHATDLLLSEIFIYKGEFAKATRILDKLQRVDPNNQHVNKLLEIAKKLPMESARVIEPTEVSRPVEGRVAGTRPPEAKPVETITIKEMIDVLANLPGVEGVLLINKEGLVAESVWNSSQEPNMYGALAKDIERVVQSQVEQSPFGKYENVLLEADGLIVNFMPIEDAMLLIKANEQINLGTLRLRLAALLEKVDIHKM
ncbi:MAG: roadblock/LC7 domain-containing protein [candidate division Zixibacteria bacterium]|nr:roadblock/LC7 domain-containing protein [candidate division Zixibacteria bacterium]